MSRDRAQSEVVGVIILVGVIVTLVGIVSVVILADVGTESAPVADLRIEAGGTYVRVTHLGGDRIPVSELDVVVRGPDSQTRFAVQKSELEDNDGDDEFEFGESLVRSHGRAAGRGRVILVHRSTNEVLGEAAVKFSA